MIDPKIFGAELSKVYASRNSEISVTLPKIAWESLLEILQSHNAPHGNFDMTTIINLYNEINNQMESENLRNDS
jgi:hypothetical protein